MPRRTKEQIKADTCRSGRHKWVEGQKRCAACDRERERKSARWYNDSEFREKKQAREAERGFKLYHNDSEWRAFKIKSNTRRNIKRRQTDVQFKLAHNLRNRLSRALKREFKTGSAVRDLGCSIPKLKEHLERQFQEGMTWDNYGEWHIDHILPLSSFDLTDRDQLLKACHYTNLQPLWATENIIKGAKA